MPSMFIKIKLIISVCVTIGLCSGCGYEVRRVAPTKEERARLIEIQTEARERIDLDSLSMSRDFSFFGGLLCYSGEKKACDLMATTQKTDGRLRRRIVDEGHDDIHSYSRDALMGWLLYILKTKDIERANKATGWLDSNDYIMCPSSGTCKFRSSTYHIYNLVALDIGSLKARHSGFDPLDIGTAVSTLFTKGSASHLQAVKLLMLQDMGYDSYGMRRTARQLAQTEPSNPFFAYLGGGNANWLVIEAWNDSYKEAEEGYLWRRGKSEWEQEGTSYADFLFMSNMLLGE